MPMTGKLKSLCLMQRLFHLPVHYLYLLLKKGFCDENDEIAYLIAKRYLSYFMDKDIDTLVLGCTHYPLLIKVIQKAVGESIKLICSAEQTALEVQRKLVELNLKNTSNEKPNISFYLTDLPNSFVETGRRFLGQELKNVKLIDI